MPADNPEGIGTDEPLSFDDAVKAYASPEDDEGADEGQPEFDEGAEDESPESSDEDETEQPEDEGQAEDDDDLPAVAAKDFAPPEAKVKLPNGGETTVAELIQGNLRDRDYRQKTMEAAELRRSVEAKASEIQQIEQQLSGDREFMVQLLQSVMPQKPDPSMYSIDPIGYGEQKAMYDARKEQLDYLLQQSQHTQQRTQAQQQAAVQEAKQREWQKTLEVMPELRDQKRLMSFSAEIQRHASEYGYTPQEIANVGLDHRQVVVLRDAIAWRKLQQQKSKVAAKVEGRPPVQRGGNRPTPEGARSRDARVAMDRLNKSGSIRDGVAALLALEKKG
jgi:hypothetical protein